MTKVLPRHPLVAALLLVAAANVPAAGSSGGDRGDLPFVLEKFSSCGSLCYWGPIKAAQ